MLKHVFAHPTVRYLSALYAEIFLSGAFLLAVVGKETLERCTFFTAREN